MFQLTVRFLYPMLVALLLVSCGGGGGGGSASTTPASTTFLSTELVAGCTGVNCSATSGATNTYSGTGTGVWRFDNASEAAVVGDINIQNVAPGKTVTLIFSNGQSSTTAPSTPSLGTLAAPIATPAPSAYALQSTGAHHHSIERAAGEAHHTQLLHANRALAVEMVQAAANKSNSAPAGIAVESGAASVLTPPSPVVLGDVRVWNENAYDFQNYSTTAKVVCAAGTLGRKVVIWVQTSIYVAVSASSSAVTDAKLALYQSQFCGTNNNDGQYAKVANLLGDVWGTVPTTYSATRISDTTSQKQDVNIVIIAPATTATWGGYFYSLNNGLRTTSSAYTNSNEALAFFVNSRQSQNYTVSVLIHELTHMINFYQRVILHNDTHESWLEETSAMMTQDIFDPGLTISGGCLPIVCDLRSYATSGAGVSYFNWPSSISTAHYNLGASFAAFLNRRYGPVIYMQLMTNCYTPTTNTSSFACLDFLIKQNGGVGFADEFAKLGASVYGRLGGTGEPSQYGFPAKSGTVTSVGNLVGSYAYSLPAFNNWWTTPSTITIPTATTLTTYPYTSQTYRVDTVAAGKTSYVRTGVTVPAKTSVLTIVK